MKKLTDKEIREIGKSLGPVLVEFKDKFRNMVETIFQATRQIQDFLDILKRANIIDQDEDSLFAYKVAEFVFKKPPWEVTQRELLRHFSNKRKDDLTRIRGRLEITYRIYVKEGGYRNKTITYFAYRGSKKAGRRR